MMRFIGTLAPTVAAQPHVGTLSGGPPQHVRAKFPDTHGKGFQGVLVGAGGAGPFVTVSPGGIVRVSHHGTGGDPGETGWY